jgi:hypothetical protein
MLGMDGKYIPRKKVLECREKLSQYIRSLEFLENYTNHYDGKVPHFTFPVRSVKQEINLNSKNNVFDIESLGIVRKIYYKDYWTGLNEFYITIGGEKISEKSTVIALESNLATVDTWELTERLKTLEEYGVNSRQVVDFTGKKLQLVFEHSLEEDITLVVEGYEIWNMNKDEDGEYSWKNL